MHEIVKGNCPNCGTSRILVFGENFSTNKEIQPPIAFYNGRCFTCESYIGSFSSKGIQALDWIDLAMDEETAEQAFGPDFDRTLH